MMIIKERLTDLMQLKICSSLEKLYPNLPIMSEENKQTKENLLNPWFVVR